MYSHVCKRARPIFNPDKRRRQAALRRTDALVQNVWKKLREHGTLEEGHTLGSAVVLHSQPGCSAQQWHMDFDPNMSKLPLKPKGVLLALEDDTSFLTPSKTYRLNAGDVLCFDGDEVHAGAGYDKSNTRIHFYADVGVSSRLRNRTWLVTTQTGQLS